MHGTMLLLPFHLQNGIRWLTYISSTCSFSLHSLLSKFFNSFHFAPRTSGSDFIVSVNKCLEAKKQKISIGMRFKMRFEGDESPERRYHLVLLSRN
jgi:hypothetical protein